MVFRSRRLYPGYQTLPDDNTVVGYSIATGKAVATFSLGSNTPDGMGIILTGTGKVPAGDLIVNTNPGVVELINPNSPTAAPVVIASGGTRGDYAGEDLLNGSLFLSQSTSVLRLSCGTGCSFGGGGGGGGGTGVPEPATLALLGLGLLGLQLAQRRRFR
jgi:PEP-CTERM motif